MSLNLPNPDLSGVSGAFESVSPNYARGWAVEGEGEDPVSVELIRDGRVIATGTTGLRRPDIARLTGRAAAGFRVAIPEHVVNVGTLSIRLARSGALLPRQDGFVVGSARADITEAGPVTQGYGRIDRVSDSRVTGWAVQPGTGEPAEVHFHAGRKLVGLVRADRERPDVEAAGAGPLLSGFETLLRLPPADGPIAVTARVVGADRLLERGTFDVAPSEAPATPRAGPSLADLGEGRLGTAPGGLVAIEPGDDDRARLAFGVSGIGKVARRRLTDASDLHALLAPLLMLGAFAGERDDHVAYGDGTTVAVLDQPGAFDCWRFFGRRRPVSLRDATLQSNYVLRFDWQVENAAEAPSDAAQIRVCQLASGGIRLADCGSVDLPPSIAPVEVALEARLFDPFRPVLVVVLDATGEVLDLDVIPFPSLCRGGWHEAEARSVSGDMDGLAAIARLSGELTERLWRRSGEGPRITVDVVGLTLTEPVAATPVALWVRQNMGGMLGISASVQGAGHLPVVPVGQADAVLPPDAVPAISLLVTSHGAGVLTAADHAVSDLERPADCWHVTMPSCEEWARALQPATAGAWFPWARVPDGSAPPFAAIRHIRRHAPQPTTALFPVASATAAENYDSARPLTVVLSGRLSDEETLVALEALGQQSANAAASLLFVDIGGGGDLPERAEILFPAGARAIGAPDRDAAMARILAETAGTGQIALFQGGSTLHDPQALARLATVAGDAHVGWVGCALAAGLPATLSLVDVGATASGVAMLPAPRLTLSKRPVALAPSRGAVPVLVPPQGILVIDLAKLRRLRPVTDSMESWLIAAPDAGLTNICVSDVTAFSMHPADIESTRAAPPLRAAGDVETMVRMGGAVRSRPR